jgi:hypothetical protein
MPWLPAIAATLGFTTGAVYLTRTASPWFVLMALLPLVVYRGLFAFAFDLVFRGGPPVEVLVTDTHLEVRTQGEARPLPLDGVFQVFREGSVWTVLHLDSPPLSIPADAITAEQVAHLRTFAHRRAAALRA